MSSDSITNTVVFDELEAKPIAEGIARRFRLDAPAEPATITPLHDLLVIEIIDGPDKVNGIVIPERARENSMRDARAGKVLAVGPGRMSESGTFVTPKVREGDVVLFPRSAGVQVECDGKLVRMIRDCELLGRMG